MRVDAETANRTVLYHLLTDVVNPRPIAWVTTINREGVVNLAPYSFFNVFGANPAIVAFSPAARRDGSKKDTLINIESTGEFVINVAVESLTDEMVLSSKEVPHEQSEIELTGLSVIASEKVKPPRLRESPVQMECRLLQILTFGEQPIAPHLVIGEVVLIHVDDSVVDEKGRVDPRKLRTIGRLGADWYCRTSDLFESTRPG